MSLRFQRAGTTRDRNRRQIHLLWVSVCIALFISSSVQSQVVMERKADGSVVITNHHRGANTVPRGRTGLTVAPAAESSAEVSEGVQVLGRAHTPTRGFPTTPELESWIATWSAHANLDQKLVKSLIAAESNFDANALSSKGAIGLMQLMPATAADLGVRDPWDPESNIRGGTRYLRMMLDRFGQDLELALAAYNAGPGAVEANGGVPPYRETRNYIRRVLSRYRGGPVELSGVRLASSSRPQYRPIRTRIDENGHLVILTP